MAGSRIIMWVALTAGKWLGKDEHGLATAILTKRNSVAIADGFNGRRASGRDGGGDLLHVHRSFPQMSAAIPQKARIARPTNAPARPAKPSTAEMRTASPTDLRTKLSAPLRLSRRYGLVAQAVRSPPRIRRSSRWP